MSNPDEPKGGDAYEPGAHEPAANLPEPDVAQPRSPKPRVSGARTPVQVRVDEDLLTWLDQTRGPLNRQQFIRNLLTREMKKEPHL